MNKINHTLTQIRGGNSEYYILKMKNKSNKQAKTTKQSNIITSTTLSSNSPVAIGTMHREAMVKAGLTFLEEGAHRFKCLHFLLGKNRLHNANTVMPTLPPGSLDTDVCGMKRVLRLFNYAKTIRLFHVIFFTRRPVSN